MLPTRIKSGGEITTQPKATTNAIANSNAAYFRNFMGGFRGDCLLNSDGGMLLLSLYEATDPLIQARNDFSFGDA